MTRQRRFTGALAAVVAFVALVILLFPLYAVVVASFENNSQLFGTHYNFLPPTPSFANYSTVISTQGGHIISSLIIGVFTAGPDPGYLTASGARPCPLPLPGDGSARGRTPD